MAMKKKQVPQRAKKLQGYNMKKAKKEAIQTIDQLEDVYKTFSKKAEKVSKKK